MVRLITTLAVLVLAPVVALASEATEKTTRSDLEAMAAAQTAQPDFLFGRPGLSVGLRGAFVRARAESEVFEFTSDLLTLEKNDFNAPAFAVDLGLSLTSRLDTLIGFEFSRASTASNYRDFIDADGLEIEQTTALSQVNLSGSLELAVLPRGRAVGQYAWVSALVTPYVGVGGGLVWYRFEQEGDFVDFRDDSIFTARLQSSGWTPAGHVSGGVDIKVARQVLVSAEARYQWADASMNEGFADFDPIDLSGLRISGGIQFVF